MSILSEIDDVLNGLGADATAEETEYALRGYGDREVRTVIANRAAAGGGGAALTPVSCLLRCDALDIHAAGNHMALWDSLRDNLWDENVITEIPAGLGLTFAFDGSSGVITVTEAGLYSVTYLAGAGTDASFAGYVADELGLVGVSFPQPGTTQSVKGVGGVLYLPVGAAWQVYISTETPAAANPYELRVRALLARLA